MKEQGGAKGLLQPSAATSVSNCLQRSDLLDTLPMATYICDVDGFVTRYNAQAALLWGRHPAVELECERSLGTLSLFHPNGDRLRHDQTAEAVCLKEGIPQNNVEVIMERPDGTRLWVTVNVAPLKDDNGQLVGTISCMYNITQKKNAEKSLLRKSMELQDYVDNANIGLHWVNAEGLIIWANKAELDMLGYTEEDYIGHHISEFHVSRPTIEDILRRLHDDQALDQYESRLRCKDGSVKNVRISSSVFREDGKFIHTRCFTVDVTTQKRLFQELADKESYYRGLTNSLPLAVYTCDKEGRITYFNEIAVQLWGYRPDIDNELLRYCACSKVFVNGAYVSPERTPMALTLQTGRSFRNTEAIIARPDGSTFHASVNIDPLYDEKNNIIGAINVFQDITGLKNAETKMRESEFRYQQLIHALDTPIYTTDTQGRINMFNEAAANLWGRKPTIGVDLWCGSFKIIQPDGTDLPLDNCPMAVCLKEQRPVYGEEILVVRPDGSLRNVAPHPQPLYNNAGDMIGAVNMLVDITELKNKERALMDSETKYRTLAASLKRKVQEATEELRKSEDKYHKMVEQVEDYAIILLDTDGIVRNWNKGAEKIKGYSEDEIVGRSFQEFYRSEDLESGLPLRLLEEARSKGKAIHEGWRQRKDGSLFWGSIVLTALHDSQGQIIGFSKVTRDLTAKKLSEDKMEQYMAQLEFQNKELEQFVYAASHDMKEPLRKIHLYNSYIADNPDNVLDERSREYFARSVQATKRMSALIGDLLAYSKVAVITESYKTVDLNIIVDEIAAFHKEDFEQNRITLERDTLPVLNAIPFQIKQLMSNVIDNAVKYKQPGKDGHIQIGYHLADGRKLKKATNRFKKYHNITVKDNGIGFEPADAAKIFEIFQRLSVGSTAKGTGIGLAICKKIIQNHNGWIEASGEPGKGATFMIFLPVD